MTDHDPASLTTPGGYLEEAQAAARNIRAWVARQNKPEYAGYASNTVDWVVGVLDNLDLVLTRATQSVNHHLPVTATLVEKQHRDERARSGLNRHRLKVAEDTTAGIAHWVNAARWSDGVKPGDLDKLESLTRRLAEHISHLSAQAQDEELAR